MNRFFGFVFVLAIITLVFVAAGLLTIDGVKAETNNKLIELPNFTRMYMVDAGLHVYRYNLNKKYYLINNEGGIIEIESPELKK